MQRQTKRSLLARTNKTKSGCWEFSGAISSTGYGKVGFAGKVWNAHRLSWFFHNGNIPDGMFVCHNCDNRKCVNPKHLFLGDHIDNMVDMLKKRGSLTNNDIHSIRDSKKCHRGHSLTKSNTYEYGKKKFCRKCRVIHSMKYIQSHS